MNQKPSVIKAEYLEKCSAAVNTYIQLRKSRPFEQLSVIKAEAWKYIVLAALFVSIEDKRKEKQHG